MESQTPYNELKYRCLDVGTGVYGIEAQKGQDEDIDYVSPT